MCCFKTRHSTHIPESITKHLSNIEYSLAKIAKNKE